MFDPPESVSSGNMPNQKTIHNGDYTPTQEKVGSSTETPEYQLRAIDVQFTPSKIEAAYSDTSHVKPENDNCLKITSHPELKTSNDISRNNQVQTIGDNVTINKSESVNSDASQCKPENNTSYKLAPHHESVSQGIPNYFVNFTDIQQFVPYFDGSAPIRAWIEGFENATEILNVSGKQKFVYCYKLLKGSADMFVKSINITSYLELKEKLFEEFEEEICAAEIHAQLKSAKREMKESMISYFYRIRNLAAKASIDDLSIKHYIVHGLNESRNVNLMLLDCEGLVSLKRKLKILDKERISPIGKKETSIHSSTNARFNSYVTSPIVGPRFQQPTYQSSNNRSDFQNVRNRNESSVGRGNSQWTSAREGTTRYGNSWSSPQNTPPFQHHVAARGVYSKK